MFQSAALWGFGRRWRSDCAAWPVARLSGGIYPRLSTCKQAVTVKWTRWPYCRAEDHISANSEPASHKRWLSGSRTKTKPQLDSARARGKEEKREISCACYSCIRHPHAQGSRNGRITKRGQTPFLDPPIFRDLAFPPARDAAIPRATASRGCLCCLEIPKHGA